jgi:hypothetical protein
MLSPWTQKSGLSCLVGLFLAMFLLGVSPAFAKKKAPPPAPGLPGRINTLAQQLPGVMLEDAAPLTSQIQKLVVDHMTDWMSSRAPGDVEVRRELENLFSLLHYPIFGQPAVFAAPWKGEVVIGAGYTLGWNDFDRQNVIMIFESQNGKSHLAAITNFVPRVDIHYEVLAAQGWDDLRFFTYGFRLGKSQPRLSAVLYAFDGQNLKSLWQQRDIYDGKIAIQQDKVVIRYLKEDEYVREVEAKRKPPRHEAIYRLTPGGLTLEDDHEIPF